jgi:hypothetical protein
MMYMAHVGDPDIYFRTKYADTAKYGTKADQYAPFERMLDQFEAPWIAAHMGGWPEDLNFLTGLLSRHPNLYLDTSATKWVARELARHPAEAVRMFFIRWKGRILFGSDIVTTEDHLRPAKERPDHPKSDQASSPEDAFDLYASRYWTLRTILETAYVGESPISDPDLRLGIPEHTGDDAAPTLRGASLPADVLRAVYRDTHRRPTSGAGLTTASRSELHRLAAVQHTGQAPPLDPRRKRGRRVRARYTHSAFRWRSGGA